MLKSSAAAPRAPADHSTEVAALHQHNSINARPIGSALFNPFVYSWSPPVAFARTDNSSRPLAATPRADSLSDVVLGLTPSNSAVTGLCVLARTI